MFFPPLYIWTRTELQISQVLLRLFGDECEHYKWDVCRWLHGYSRTVSREKGHIALSKTSEPLFLAYTQNEYILEALQRAGLAEGNEMILAEILRHKGNDVFKLIASTCVADAATILTDKKIGAVLVEDERGDVVGILSERDIVGGMGPHGADLHDVPVSELMTTNVIRCSPNDEIIQAMTLMTDRRIRHLPVFEGDQLVGIISVGDLVKYRISEVEAEASALRQYIVS